MACVVYGLELQILAFADQLELGTKLMQAFGQTHVARAEYQQRLDMAVEYFAQVTGRSGIGSGAEPSAQRLHRTFAGRSREAQRNRVT